MDECISPIYIIGTSVSTAETTSYRVQISGFNLDNIRLMMIVEIATADRYNDHECIMAKALQAKALKIYKSKLPDSSACINGLISSIEVVSETEKEITEELYTKIPLQGIAG